MALTCFLPCRRGSERVENKNTRPFAGFERGLIEVKLRQLNAAERIGRVVLSTNDEQVMAAGCELGGPKVEVVPRPEHLCLSSTSTDELIAYVPELIADGDVLWTHVTSPFLTAADYDRIVEAYEAERGEGYDSLMTVTPLREFVWDGVRPLNYDREVERWPRTQTLDPLFAVNSGVFLCPREHYVRRGDRIGERPYLYPLDRIVGLDVDWMEEFHLAEALVASGRATI